DRHRRAERGRSHRQRDPAVQIVTVTGEQRMRPLADLDVEIAGRPAAGADLALTRQPQPHAVVDARGHLDGDRAPRADPTLAGTVRARVADPAADTAALGAGA